MNGVGCDALQRRQHGVLPDRAGMLAPKTDAVVAAADRDADQLVLLEPRGSPRLTAPARSGVNPANQAAA